MFDPFEYLVLRDKDGLLRKDFKTPLGKVSYHIPCHSRVQNVGQKTREVLEWIPETTVNTVERCAGHDGTYGVKSEFFAALDEDRQARLPPDGARPSPTTSSSDCPIAGRRIVQGIDESGSRATRAQGASADAGRMAYGLE